MVTTVSGDLANKTLLICSTLLFLFEHVILELLLHVKLLKMPTIVLDFRVPKVIAVYQLYNWLLYDRVLFQGFPNYTLSRPRMSVSYWLLFI